MEISAHLSFSFVTALTVTVPDEEALDKFIIKNHVKFDKFANKILLTSVKF